MKIEDSVDMLDNADSALLAALTLAGGDIPGTGIPKASSTARTVCTKLTWTNDIYP